MSFIFKLRCFLKKIVAPLPARVRRALDTVFRLVIVRSVLMREDEASVQGLKDLSHYILGSIPGEKTVVEVGSYAGESTEIFAATFQRVYAVDPWMPGYDDKDPASQTDMVRVEKRFDKRMVVHKNVHKMKMTSAEAVQQFQDQSLDFIYRWNAYI